MAWNRVQLVAEHLALLGKGNLLLHGGTDPKELAHFIKSATKACCRDHTSEPTHRVIALLDAMVVLFPSIVEIVIGPVEHVTAHGLADRSWIGVMAIGRHPLWGVTNDIDGLRRSKCLAASISRFSARHRINQIAISIDGAIQIAPCSLDVDVGFIHVPGASCLPSSLGT